MIKSLDILKLRVLLCFLNEDEKTCTVTGLSALLGEGKQKMHRLLAALEREGLLDRSNARRPCLTAEGRQRAAFYEDRVGVVVNHLLYEGLDLDEAEQNAYAWALFSTDKAMEIFRSSEQRYRAKYELRRQQKFDGAELCRRLPDGEYRLPFLFYKEHISAGSNLSMANRGFEHPCVLKVENGCGMVHLKPISASARSPLTGREMNGHNWIPTTDNRLLRRIIREGQDGGEFRPAQDCGGTLAFPARVLSFLNLGYGMEQILHGSVCLRMQASVGTNHMPESTVLFTILF